MDQTLKIAPMERTLSRVFVEISIREILKSPVGASIDYFSNLGKDVPYVSQVISNAFGNPIRERYTQFAISDMSDIKDLCNRYLFNIGCREDPFRLQSAGDQALVIVGLVYAGMRRVWNTRIEVDFDSFELRVGIEAGMTFYQMAAVSPQLPSDIKRQVDSVAFNFREWVEILSYLPRNEQIAGFLINV